MGKNHASQYANFGSLQICSVLGVELPYYPIDNTFVREKICLLYNANVLDFIVSYHVNWRLVDVKLHFCICHFHEFV